MLRKPDKNKFRKKRHLRIRNHIIGSSVRPRLNVFRSIKNIFEIFLAHIVDDSIKIFYNRTNILNCNNNFKFSWRRFKNG